MAELRWVLFAITWMPLLGCLPGLAADLSLERGVLPVQQFHAKTYGASPQNWAIVQDLRGVLYIGNTDGLLEYDSVSWRHLSLPSQSMVRSLALGSDGKVLVGGQGDFGYLEGGDHGRLQFRSLLSELPPQDRQFGDVWGIVAAPDGAYFSSDQRLIRLSPSHKVKVWNAPTPLKKVFLVNNQVFVATRKGGILQVEGDLLREVPGTSQFNSEVRGLFLWNGKLTAALTDSIYQADATGFSVLKTEADPLLREYKLYSVLPLAGGTLALGAARGGLILLNASGRVDRRLAKEDGLPSDYVTSLYTDRQGGIWLTTTAGVARIDPAITHFDERQGLRGGVVSLARQDSTLYAGTLTGLYKLQTQPGRPTTMQPVNGIPESVTSSLPSPEGFLVGAKGLYLLQGDHVRSIFATDGIYDLTFSREDPAVLYLVGRAGLTILRHTGGEWRKTGEVQSTGAEFRSVLEDNDGRVWVANRSDVLRVNLKSSPPKIEHFDSSAGVPAGWKNWFRVDGNSVLATEKGLLKFEERTAHFAPDAALGNEFSDGSRGVSLIREDPHKNLWITGVGYHGVLIRQDGNRKWLDMPLAGAGLDELYAIHTDLDGTVWAAGPDGILVRSESPIKRTPAFALDLLVRRVQAQGERFAAFSGTGSTGNGRFEFPYRSNALRFEFAAPFFEPENHTEYQVQLANGDWSSWTSETRRDYTNLTEGGYMFRVRARNPRFPQIAEASFRFRIHPPWYRTRWAYLIWAAMFCSTVWLVFRWRMRHLRESNRKLEALVEERTVEITRQRDQIQEHELQSEAMLLNILPSSIAAELRETGAVVPMLFEQATVCFTDFVGFTLASEKLTAREVVDTLHTYFTAFDEIIGRYGIEKLKTIGDAYMFAAGLPERRASHAVDAVLAALEIIEKVRTIALERPNAAWEIRIGLHSGPIVGGVVGVRKFAFDIWGNAVNFAARVEASGASGRVSISEITYEAVKDFIRCEPRGLINTKEGRSYPMYFACEIRRELLEGSETGSPERFRELYEKRFGETLPVALDDTWMSARVQTSEQCS